MSKQNLSQARIKNKPGLTRREREAARPSPPGERIPVGRILLEMIEVAGIMSTIFIMPNGARALELFGFNKRRGTYPKQNLYQAFYRLKKNNLVTLEIGKGGEEYMRLTDKGRARLILYQQRERILEKPEYWDGKWRIIIFDISERKRAIRNRLREEVSNLGFFRLQNSVWVYPYECRELVTLLKGDLEIGKELLYITAEQIEGEDYLRRVFKLSRVKKKR